MKGEIFFIIITQEVHVWTWEKCLSEEYCYTDECIDTEIKFVRKEGEKCHKQVPLQLCNTFWCSAILGYESLIQNCSWGKIS